jgi:hypothetical protein
VIFHGRLEMHENILDTVYTFPSGAEYHIYQDFEPFGVDLDNTTYDNSATSAKTYSHLYNFFEGEYQGMNYEIQIKLEYKNEDNVWVPFFDNDIHYKEYLSSGGCKLILYGSNGNYCESSESCGPNGYAGPWRNLEHVGGE